MLSRLALALPFCALLAATATVAVRAQETPPAATQEPAEADAVKVRFMLDWRIEGPAALFTTALDKGYFEEEGLDVTIEPVAGSVEPIHRLQAGEADLGVGDLNSLIVQMARTDTPRVRAVYMLYNTPPFAIVGRKSRGISDPASLMGKVIGAPAGDAAAAQWPVFARAHDIKSSEIRFVPVGFPVREPMLASGELDAAIGYAHTIVPNLTDKGVPAGDIVVLPMTGPGVDLYGSAIMVNDAFARENPEAVRGFLRALTHSIKDVAANPNAAIAGVAERNPGAKRALELERLTRVLKDNVLTPDVRAHGLGGVETGRLERTIKLLGEAHNLGDMPAANTLFDASFLPDAALRALAEPEPETPAGDGTQ